ncbi:ATG16 [Candida oxycetoniae]|uniref:ATG16 n=1 Tax=Candida oxycetoniae TaxID=497107 RepID=A0AAI9SYS1_9ASCO|nr:ATG16 [Candida oxycetoniae]KAI3405266.2 ATG16 [Candida oxycetoniae]
MSIPGERVGARGEVEVEKVSSTAWANEVLKSLAIRDEVEKKDLQYFQAFDQLCERIKGLQEEAAAAAAAAAATPLSSLVTSKTSKSQQQIESGIIFKQNQQLTLENNDLITNLNSVTLKNERLEMILNEKNKSIKSLQRLNAQLKQKTESLSLEIKEKNKTIEFVNDELLTYQMQNNVLRAHYQHYRAERDSGAH